MEMIYEIALLYLQDPGFRVVLSACVSVILIVVFVGYFRGVGK